MDLVITNLSDVSNLSKKGVFELCNKVFHYLSTHFESEYDWNDMETLIKMAVVINDSSIVCAEEYIKDLDNDQWYLENLHELQSLNYYQYLAQKILQSSNLTKNAVFLDNILSHVKKYTNYRIKTKLDIDYKYLDVNRKKMYLIIERVFVLPHYEIDRAIDRILAYVDFEVLGYIFCESPCSFYFDKCIILQDIICTKIKNIDNNIVNYFIRSIFASVTGSKGGELFYQQCLKNKEFSTSLNYFFKSFLKSIDLSRQCSFIVSNKSFDKCVILEVFYICFYAVNSKSLEDFKNIQDINSYIYLKDLLSYINMLFL